MMGKILLIIGLIAALASMSCRHADEKSKYVIEGTVGTREFDGEWMYLVPLDNAPGRVDSVRITDGKFRFEGHSAEMKVLRVSYLFRLRLQELLVATEPGLISVHIDSISSGGGTPQNDEMQLWKERQIHYNAKLHNLLMRRRTAPEDAKAAIDAAIDSVTKNHIDSCFVFAKKMKGTVFGDFLNRTVGASFSPEQKKQLE